MTTEDPAPTTTEAAPAQTTMVEPPARKAWEEWVCEKNTPPMDWERTAIMHRWPIGREMTEHDFDAAIYAAAHVAIR